MNFNDIMSDLSKIMEEKNKFPLKWFGLASWNFYTDIELKRKYHTLAKQYHSDISKDSARKMYEINEAYSYLKYFCSKPIDKETRLRDQELRKLRYDILSIDSLLKFDKCSENGKKGRRLNANSSLIKEQTAPILSGIFSSLQQIDNYIIQNPDSSVTKYIKNKIKEILYDNSLGYKYVNQKCDNKLIYAQDQYYICKHEYKKGMKGCYNITYTGTCRNDMKKARNYVCNILVQVAKEIQNILLVMNNGCVNIDFDDKTDALMNVLYMKEYEDFDDYFLNIRKSSNYYCYISLEEKEKLAKRL